MADQEKKELDPTALEVTELEDEDLDSVSGGDPNSGCPVNNGCTIPTNPGCIIPIGN